MIPDSTRSTEPGSRSATTANGGAKTGLPTTVDQLHVQIHVALTQTRNEFRAARIAAMKWDLSDDTDS
jgi:hypothetical protein